MDRRAGAFIPAAAAWLVTGAVLGLLMAAWPGAWLRLKPAHVAVVTVGWMTMLMFAMTLLVIPVFIRRQVVQGPWVPAQWLAANAGVAAVFAGHAAGSPRAVVAGWVLLAAAGVLFLLNIVLSARRGAAAADGEERARRLAHPALDPEAMRAVDRLARRYTETSVLLLVAGGALMALAWAGRAGAGGDAAGGYLLRYGWMSLLAWGTAYHMLPRWSGVLPRSLAAVRWQLVLAVAGTLVAAAGALGGWGLAVRTGVTLIAAAALVFSANVWGCMFHPLPDRGVSRGRTTSGAFIAASGLSLAAAGAAGLTWALAGMPAGWFLAMTHLYLLGWQTLLAYGVAGWLLPLLAGVPFARPGLYRAQLALALPGVAGVAATFLLRDRFPAWPWPAIFGSFATLCALAAILFAVNLVLTVMPVLGGRGRAAAAPSLVR
ncbi:hypothetical protein [Caldinitratiruptor microaerophilus]|uniref:Uncharacterized protein n=1 Tax=Caldinitratiruptor microaerophilus TaxID=671077 RepID=A0AA35CM01_9FIRM|nr:hypothetical protein [Caldinitratiruptor microaerophilus]BDG61597.1 hypothetical protein caldi_26870 [Caldinitratiruptor microaerophilus]